MEIRSQRGKTDIDLIRSIICLKYLRAGRTCSIVLCKKFIPIALLIFLLADSKACCRFFNIRDTYLESETNVLKKNDSEMNLSVKSVDNTLFDTDDVSIRSLHRIM